MSDPAAFEAHRGRLTGLAYRMLGSRADAEDAVQDAFLRWSGAQAREAIENEEAYLVRIVTRLCLDRLKSAKARREIYVGPWLPEPIVDTETLSPHTSAELADDLSFALLVALDRLTPAERAAFLLHDVFDAPFSEVAATLEKSEAACRQLATRARKAVRDARPAPPAPPEAHPRLLAAFINAVNSGDVAQLTALLREDAIAITDGGGFKTAALNPLHGADRIARFFIGVVRKQQEAGVQFHFQPAEVNGAIGLLVYLDGFLDQTFSIAPDGERIAAIYAVRNPEKLGAVVRALAH
jgi:RNA polymerase sigma-70 factor (ECF subfamily)